MIKFHLVDPFKSKRAAAKSINAALYDPGAVYYFIPSFSMFANLPVPSRVIADRASVIAMLNKNYNAYRCAEGVSETRP
jgi:hypothetical protein